MQKIALFLCVLLMTAACSKQAVKPTPLPTDKPPIEKPVTQKPTTEKPPTDKPITITPPIDSQPSTTLKPANWQDLDGLLQDDVVTAWPAWLQSCARLVKKVQWKTACDAAQTMKQPNNAAIIDYLSNYFDVYRAHNEEGTTSGTITGYYQPLLNGSRTQSKQYPYPLYKEPKDLITVELADLYPELKYKRIRGKLEDKKLVPYRTRGEIDANPSPLAGNELFWIDDMIDVFFLQIQGSGVVQLENGEQVQVGYANQNGYPYKSIGKLLVEQGELTLDKASMQGIKNWATNNPDKLPALLNSNPSYVFFRELPAGLPGPLGALSVPITAERSVAIDPKFIPLGAPIFLSTTEPNSSKPLKRLMLAQDTGGAIRGGVRADFFWGVGDEAGARAGSMKQDGEIWVLLPKGFVVGE
ncbi:MAG: MltA domain-containing protein [Methylophilaceae bacterium]|nr:MltA domain-containing protein [Methylophilaceae bacterium]